MLSYELLRFRVSKGKARPSFIDPADSELRAVAERVCSVLDGARGRVRAEVEDELDSLTSTLRPPKLGKGLLKLASDRLEVEEPDSSIAQTRYALFIRSAAVLRSLPPDASLEDHQTALEAEIPDLASARADLYSDHPNERRILEVRSLSPLALLERYNLALAQGLILRANALSLTVPQASTPATRRLLRWLKFCRLVFGVESLEDGWKIEVEGPGRIVQTPKRYGLALAQFFAMVPSLPEYRLFCQVDLPKRGTAELHLDQSDPIVCPYHQAAGHVPDEVRQSLADFAPDDGWTVDLTCGPRHTGAKQVCVPDFRLVSERSADERFVELFHRWHAGPLRTRLDALESRPDPELLIGVDRSLVKDPALRGVLEGHAQVFVFNKYPTWKKIRPLLAPIQSASGAPPPAKVGRESADGVEG